MILYPSQMHSVSLTASKDLKRAANKIGHAGEIIRQVPAYLWRRKYDEIHELMKELEEIEEKILKLCSSSNGSKP